MTPHLCHPYKYKRQLRSFRNRVKLHQAMCAFRMLLFLLAAIASIDAAAVNVTQPTEWWQTTTLYQIWPPSFKDSDGDGIGDLNGITSKLEHLVDMGIEVLWLSPIYPSPMADSGYDISDFYNINPTYGTLDDFDNLVAEAKRLGLKVIMDYVPNHTSDEHEWFLKSKNGTYPYTDYYVWNEGIIGPNGTRRPPNNWLNAFNSGSAWTWVEERQAYYLHQFHEKQPDLNFRNPEVIRETEVILSFWLSHGVDGFRIDSVPYLIEDEHLADEPLSGLDGYTPTDYYYLDHVRTKDQSENYDIVQIWKERVNLNGTLTDGVERVLFTEAYARIEDITPYYSHGSDVPFNFFLIKDENGINPVALDTAEDVVGIIHKWMDNMPYGATANWVLGNHDNSRVATRHGSESVDGLNFLLFLLPGVATIYNSDEIGMTDTYLSWEDTRDPQACNTDETRYEYFSRDPERTPYQWDSTTSAGFSRNSSTELPVNGNYLRLNLAAQKAANVSHYKNVQAAIRLRNTTVIREGSLDAQVIDDRVIAFAREHDDEPPIVVLINWKNTADVTISLEVFPNIGDTLEVMIADINSGIKVGDVYNKRSVRLPGNAAVVLRGTNSTSVDPPTTEIPSECEKHTSIHFNYESSSRMSLEIDSQT